MKFGYAFIFNCCFTIDKKKYIEAYAKAQQDTSKTRKKNKLAPSHLRTEMENIVILKCSAFKVIDIEQTKETKKETRIEIC